MADSVKHPSFKGTGVRNPETNESAGVEVRTGDRTLDRALVVCRYAGDSACGGGGGSWCPARQPSPMITAEKIAARIAVSR